MFFALILKEGGKGKMECLTGNREEAESYLREERGSLQKNLSPRVGEVCKRDSEYLHLGTIKYRFCGKIAS